MTYSYAVLEVSAETYKEIADKLRAAGYDVFRDNSKYPDPVIDMHGVALALGLKLPPCPSQ